MECGRSSSFALSLSMLTPDEVVLTGRLRACRAWPDLGLLARSFVVGRSEQGRRCRNYCPLLPSRLLLPLRFDRDFNAAFLAKRKPKSTQPG